MQQQSYPPESVKLRIDLCTQETDALVPNLQDTYKPYGKEREDHHDFKLSSICDQKNLI